MHPTGPLPSEPATKLGIIKTATNPKKRQIDRAIRTLAFPDSGKLRLAISSQPERVNPMAIAIKTEAKQKFRNVSAPKLENPKNARPPVKRAAIKKPDPTNILKACI